MEYWDWPIEKVREVYSRSVAYYAYLLSCGFMPDENIMVELRYQIEDSFDKIVFHNPDINYGDEKSDADLVVMDAVYDARDAYRHQHPEWYAEDALRFGVL